MEFLKLGNKVITHAYTDDRALEDLLVDTITRLLSRELILLLEPSDTEGNATELGAVTCTDKITKPAGSVFITTVFKEGADISVRIDPRTACTLVGTTKFFPDLNVMVAGSADCPKYYLNIVCNRKTAPILQAILPELVQPFAEKPGFCQEAIPSAAYKLTPHMFAHIEASREGSLNNILPAARRHGFDMNNDPKAIATEYLLRTCEKSTLKILERFKNFT